MGDSPGRDEDEKAGKVLKGEMVTGTQGVLVQMSLCPQQQKKVLPHAGLVPDLPAPSGSTSESLAEAPDSHGRRGRASRSLHAMSTRDAW